MQSKPTIGPIISILALVFCWLSVSSAHAQQVGSSITADGAAPNTNAMLDIQSPATGDGKGLLIPRVTLAQRTTASAALAGGLLDDAGDLRGGPARGLLVFQTDGTMGIYYNSNATATPNWIYMGTGTGDGDLMADGSVPMTDRFNMNNQVITNVNFVSFSDGNVRLGDRARSYSSASNSVAVGRNSTARYRIGGVSIGADSDGDYNGVALGYSANGQYTNIAIGFNADCRSGYDRIAIGNGVTAWYNDSCAIRGAIYLDGTGANHANIRWRQTFDTGSWNTKTFAIDHPLDPKNRILRHYCMEGPQVWNVYAGNATLRDGRASVELPDYYGALNKEGSEVYSLTVISEGDSFPLVKVAEKVKHNMFIIKGTHDVEVSWTIKVLRNDKACLEDLKKRPVEQLKSEISPQQLKAENLTVNTSSVTAETD